MFAIVRTGGKQYRVAAGDKIVVEKLAGDAGDTITLGDILLAGDGSDLKKTDGLTVAAEIIAQAEKRAAQLVDEARNAAKEEGNREKAAAKAEISQEISRAREQLRNHVASLAVAGAEKILRREVDAKAHADLLESIKRQL